MSIPLMLALVCWIGRGQTKRQSLGPKRLPVGPPPRQPRAPPPPRMSPPLLPADQEDDFFTGLVPAVAHSPIVDQVRPVADHRPVVTHQAPLPSERVVAHRPVVTHQVLPSERWEQHPIARDDPLLVLPEVPGQPLAENVPGAGVRVAWAAARCAAQLTGYALEVNDGTESLHFDASTGQIIVYPWAARLLPADQLEVTLRNVPTGVSLRFRVAAVSAAGRGSPSPYSRAVSFAGPSPPPDAPAALTVASAAGPASPSGPPEEPAACGGCTRLAEGPAPPDALAAPPAVSARRPRRAEIADA